MYMSPEEYVMSNSWHLCDHGGFRGYCLATRTNLPTTYRGLRLFLVLLILTSFLFLFVPRLDVITAIFRKWCCCRLWV